MARQSALAERFSDLMNKAMRDHKAKRYSQAIKRYESALSLSPKHPGALANLGLCFFEQGRAAKALPYFRAANETCPNEAFIQANLGACLLDLGRAAEALPWLSRTLNRNPTDVAAGYLVGRALHELRRLDEALAVYARFVDIALDRKPDLALDMALVFLKKNDHRKAAELALRLSARQPDWMLPNFVAFSSFLEIADWRNLHTLDRSAEQDLLDDAHDVASPRGDYWTPFAAVNRFSDERTHLKVARRTLERDLRKLGRIEPLAPRAAPDPDRLRIGYLSSDFHDHPVMHLLESVLDHHARSAIDVYCYATTKRPRDRYRDAAAASATGFRDVSGLSPREIAETIHRDRLDLIIDLNGHTQDSRITALSYRPAPIQATYLGFPGTSGADFIDYVIADSCVVPEASFQNYSETVAWHPLCYLPCVAPAPKAAATTRESWGLPDGAVVFCSFNAVRKIEPVRFASWMACLDRVEGSVLWLSSKNAEVDDALQREAEAAGIAPDRLIFAGRVPSRSEHLERLGHADLALDTRLYNGHATTVDALMAGVPVVATLGSHFAARVSASVLAAAGLSDLITATEEAFVERAVAIAGSAHERAAAAARVRSAVGSSPLFDAGLYASKLEDLYRAMVAAGPARRRKDRLTPVTVS